MDSTDGSEFDALARRLATEHQLTEGDLKRWVDESAHRRNNNFSAVELRNLLARASFLASMERYPARRFELRELSIEAGIVEGLHVPQRLTFVQCDVRLPNDTGDEEIQWPKIDGRQVPCLLFHDVSALAFEWEKGTFDEWSSERDGNSDRHLTLAIDDGSFEQSVWFEGVPAREPILLNDVRVGHDLLVQCTGYSRGLAIRASRVAGSVRVEMGEAEQFVVDVKRVVVGGRFALSGLEQRPFNGAIRMRNVEVSGDLDLLLCKPALPDIVSWPLDAFDERPAPSKACIEFEDIEARGAIVVGRTNARSSEGDALRLRRSTTTHFIRVETPLALVFRSIDFGSRVPNARYAEYLGLMPGLELVDVAVGQDVHLRDCSAQGDIYLGSPKFSGSLKVDNGEFGAIATFDAMVGRAVDLRGVTAWALLLNNSDIGVLRLTKTRISKNPDRGDTFEQTLNGMLSLNGANVHRSITLEKDCEIYGIVGENLEVNGDVDLTEGRIGAAGIDLSGARIDRLKLGYITSNEAKPKLILSRVTIGTLEDKPKDAVDNDWEIEAEDMRVGTVRDDLSTPDEVESFRKPWLGKCGGQTDPQLAARFAEAYRARGADNIADRLMVVRNRARATSSRQALRTMEWLVDVTGEYGFAPQRALIWFFVLCFVSGVLFHLAATLPMPRHQSTPPTEQRAGSVAFLQAATAPAVASGTCDGCVGLFVPTVLANYNTDKVRAPYPPFNPWFYSLDAALPFVDLGMERHWAPNLAYPAQPWSKTWFGMYLLQILVIFEALFGAILLTIALAGFAGLLRRGDGTR